MSKFAIHIIVPAKMIGTIIDLLDNEGILVSVTPIDDEKKPSRHRVPRSRKNTQTGQELVLQLLSSGAKTPQQLSTLFQAQGFSSSSYSPCCSKLHAAGKIHFSKTDGKWRLTDNTEQRLGAA